MNPRPAVARWIRAKHWTPSEDPGRIEIRAGRLGRGRVLAVRHERGNRGGEGRADWIAAIAREFGVRIVYDRA